jgi:hypothetical protein
VFLAGERAYKVKRAVKFPFLDYSTAAKRKAACEAELEVNRPFAPQLYLGIVAIARAAGGLALGRKGRGRSIGRSRCAASTRTRQLDHLADRGRSDAGLGRLARVRHSDSTRARAQGSKPDRGSRRSQTLSDRTMRRCARGRNLLDSAAGR